MSIEVLPPPWSLQDFERELASMEVERLVGSPVERQGDILRLSEPLHHATVARLARRVSFARAIKLPDRMVSTLEHALELSAGGGTRKVTSHALHGLHPYKGKFYPQLARSLLNICAVPANGVVLDPFAGCGTSVLEASLLGIRGIGVDANPVAVLVSRAKLQLLGHPVHEVAQAFHELRELPEDGVALPDESYLATWFPVENLSFLRRAISRIRTLESPIARDGALVALSSVLREASYQDPQQLRVGRRFEWEEIPALPALFYRALDALVQDLGAVQSIRGLAWERIPRRGSRVLEGDSRDLTAVLRRHARRPFDAVITSPPYAAALPYIDTDRLSLRAFGLLRAGSQRQAESKMIGNREITEREREAQEQLLLAELAEPTWTPESLRELLRATLDVAHEPASGFRKRRTPALLFNYFRDMRKVLEQLPLLMRPRAPVAIVVGDNTVAGPQETLLRIPTADIIASIGKQIGLQLEDDLSKRLTSFGASDTVHQRNAMEKERVLLFRCSGK